MNLSQEIKELRKSTKELLIICIASIIIFFFGTLIPLLVMFNSMNNSLSNLL